MTDNELIEQIKQGSKDAFGILAKRYQPKLRGRLRRVVPKDDVEDVMQDVFLRVLKTIHTFRGDSSFATWLASVTSNTIVEYYRSRARRMKEYDPRFAASGLTDPWFEVGRRLMLEEVLEEVLKAVHSLIDTQKEVITLSLEDKPFTEIAEELGIAYEAARSRYWRGVRNCRRLLESP